MALSTMAFQVGKLLEVVILYSTYLGGSGRDAANGIAVDASGSAFVAGPTCGLYLAQMGAEVIRFDNIGGGPDFRRWPLAEGGGSLYWEGLNKAKKSVALDLAELPPDVTAAILTALRLPLALGMQSDDVMARLGEPDSVDRYGADRTTYNFTSGAEARYAVSCTIHEAAGLIYLTVLAPTPRRPAVGDRDEDA